MGNAIEPSASQRWLLRAWKGLRDLWLIVGISLVMLVVLEFAYRAQAAVKRPFIEANEAGAATPRPRHPYDDSTWYAVFRRERDSILAWRWEPYSYSRMRPLKGRYITVDSAGIRVTPKPTAPGPTNARPLRIFFFGGSTTWGFADRDSNTRAAVVARRMTDAGTYTEAVNFGQLGYVGAQGVHTLVTELRRGNVPDAVVFWDGVNDVASARNNGAPGLSNRESERAEDADFNMARRRRGGVVDGRLAVRSLMFNSQLFRRLLRLVDRPPRPPPLADPTTFCRAVMLDWAAQARLVEALGRSYHFVPILVWQPQWQTGGRPKSAFEREVASLTIADPEGGLDAHRMECARVADSLAQVMPGSVFNWARMHAEDTGTVYIDEHSHTTERVTALEADTLAKILHFRLRLAMKT